MRVLLLAMAVALATPAPAIAARHGADVQRDAQRDAAAGAELQRTLAGLVPGEPVNCIPLGNVTGSTIVGGRAIVYRIGSRLYVNEPRSGAALLHRDDILLTRTIGSDLCRLDIVRLLDSTSRIPHGFVSLGSFVPYTRPKTR